MILAEQGCGRRRCAAPPGVTLNASLGKVKLPPASSITLTWQTYVPGFKSVSGTSNWNATAFRATSVTAFAVTRGVS